MKAKIVRTTAILVVGTMASCALRRQASPTEPHWVHDQRLRSVMSFMDGTLAAETPLGESAPLPPESSAADPGPPKSEADALDRACRLAESLALSARQIPHSIDAAEMADGDRRAFAALVDTLRDQAIQLEEAAAYEDVDGMRRVLSDIGATCTSCHTRFADVASPAVTP